MNFTNVKGEDHDHHSPDKTIHLTFSNRCEKGEASFLF